MRGYARCSIRPTFVASRRTSNSGAWLLRGRLTRWFGAYFRIGRLRGRELRNILLELYAFVRDAIPAISITGRESQPDDRDQRKNVIAFAALLGDLWMPSTRRRTVQHRQRALPPPSRARIATGAIPSRSAARVQFFDILSATSRSVAFSIAPAAARRACGTGRNGRYHLPVPQRRHARQGRQRQRSRATGERGSLRESDWITASYKCQLT